MSLDHYRQKLNERLATCSAKDSKALLEAIENWWLAYKAWEAEETFTRAFKDKRMTVRTIKYATVHKPLSMVRVAEPTKGKQELGGQSDTGITGLMKRLDPKNFVALESRSSSKYELGLHDMSASLLHPDRQISHQLYGWGFQTDSHAVTQSSSYYVVFMPLGQTADMAVFSALSVAAKEMKSTAGEVYQKVRDIRSEFTRIKLADKDDSHIGFVDISKTGDLKRKYRYGLNSSDAETGNVETERTIRRRNDALKYTSILETAQERSLRLNSKTAPNKFYNEIIVAYRKHASGRFPLFTRWANNAFQVVQSEGQGMTDVPGQSVSASGVCTGF